MNKLKIIDIDLNVARKLGINKVEEYGILPIKEEMDKVIICSTTELKDNKEEIEFIYNKKIEVLKVGEENLKDLIYKSFLGEQEKLIEIIISKSINEIASDIHFEPQRDDIVIRIRIDGILVPFTKIKSQEYQKVLSQIKVLGNMDITEKRKPQDGKAYIKIGDRDYDLRLSTIPIVYGEKLVIRILYGDVFRHNINELNLSRYQREKINKMISMKNGLILINGPTGSGKSTTLYSILNEVNKNDVNITTLEDPVEVLIKGINQVSLNKKANITFATGLRSILRQDPDIIMVGEVRDEETANMVVTASLTGHKVYSTIHTKTPKEVFFRLEDMGVKSYLIKDSLIGIISQRLIKTLCNKCKEKSDEVKIKDKLITTYESIGCIHCNYTGYKGRKSVSSVVYIDEKIRELISNIFQEIIELSNEEMVINLIYLIENGAITINDYNKFLIEEGLNYEKNKIII